MSLSRLCNISAKPIQVKRNCKLAQLSSILRADEINSTSTPNVTDDLNSIIPKLDLSNAALESDEQKKHLSNLLQTYSDVFSTSSLDFGCTSTIKHCIPMIDDKPFRITYRRIPPSQYEAVKDHLKNMEATEAIRRSSSPYASPMVIVYKKDGSLRICVDYRQLNNKTVRDAFPLPRIEEALDALRNAQFFSTLDLTSGYWQVEMEEKDKQKTAFTTPMGLFECNRMPFGLQNAPATFQRLMMTCLGDLNYSKVLLYLDDIIIFSNSFEEHIKRLSEVFSRLRHHGLKLKPSKCFLLRTEVNHL